MTARKDYIRCTVVAPGPKDGPNWYILIRGPGVRRRISSGTTDRAEAEAQAREREGRMNARLSPKRGEDPLVITVMDRHIAAREADVTTAPATLDTYHRARAALAAPLVDVRASTFTRAAVTRAQLHLVTRLDHPALAPITANLYMSKLKHAWEWAAREGHPGVGAWPGHDGLPVERTRKREYRPEELDRVLRAAVDYAEGRMVPLLCLLAEIGPRISEAVAIRGRDLDRSTGALTLYTRKTGRRGGRRTRTVLLSPEVLAMLPDRRPDEWLFRAARDADSALCPRVAREALRRIRERAGLGREPLDLHSFRRYVVRKLHRAGVPLRDAMSYVGHESMRAHLAYMDDVLQPEQQKEIIVKARVIHDPIALLATGAAPPGISDPPDARNRPADAESRAHSARRDFPGQVPCQVTPPAYRISMRAKDAAASDRTDENPPETGMPSRSEPRAPDGSDVEDRASVVPLPSRDPRADELARALAVFAPRLRRLVLEALADPDLAAASLVASRDYWPDDAPPAPGDAGATRARKATS